jgi:hypothetical protein
MNTTFIGMVVVHLSFSPENKPEAEGQTGELPSASKAHYIW